MIKSTRPSIKLQPEELMHIADLIQRQFGLIYNGEKLNDLERCLHRTLQNIPQEHLNRVTEQLLAGHFEQIPDLISQLTIPETYFLRNIRLFRALKNNLLPEIIRRKKYTRQIAIWSAGSSSGEEPYSVAILLYELLGKDLDLWTVNLIATDLNAQILKKAQQAVYSEWSFRGVPPDFKARYFKPIGKDKFQLIPEISKRVTFLQHNLIEGPFPPVSTIRHFDLILCRNVMIYMSREAVQTILDKFHRVLHPQGYLVTGPSEFPTLKNKEFRPILLHGTIVYKKSTAGDFTSPVKTNRPIANHDTPSRHQPPKPTKQSFAAKRKLYFPLEFTKKDEKKSTEACQTLNELALIRQAADKGHLDEALELCTKYVKRKTTDKNGYYLLGTVLMEKGDVAQAEDNFRRAIYFDPDFVMAHFALANIYAMNNRTEESRKFYRNVLKILESRNPEETVPQSEGMAVSQFRELVKKMINMPNN